MSQIPREERCLRLGIDGEALRRPLSGVGHYVYQLCQQLEALFPTAELFAYSRLGMDQLNLPSERWQLRQEHRAKMRRVPSFAWLKTRGRKLALADKLDVFWAGRTIHPGLPATVYTISTVHDLNHRIVPETMQWSTRLSHRLWFERDIKSAACILANSEGTATRLQRLLGIEVTGICRPGLNSRYRVQNKEELERAHLALSNMGIRAPFLLCVATLEPRKNVDKVLGAFLALVSRGQLTNTQLVIAGAKGWQNAELHQRLESNKSKGVVVTGYIPDELMPGLYAHASALVFPSTYEGFGMPVLEARACGTPAIISDIPELKEAAGGEQYCISPTVEAIRDGILRVLNARSEPIPLGDQDYSWRASARDLAQAVNKGLAR